MQVIGASADALLAMNLLFDAVDISQAVRAPWVLISDGVQVHAVCGDNGDSAAQVFSHAVAILQGEPQ